ncbi:gliding motility-associated C-terminal domain-containing protein [Pontibacter sp. JH31]|uniref:Gliding motility-associated C-terminal domain-containing protein n=1 Tax=Pontibacter aquaedesilientis TaxID=2766980 RepID=A0ABR7XH30_9BACT|nr:gliding motility-associated C-terminal domain-containing protein [Pontibacter aquaedesilientis]MBD1397619.1 gliding motility-associated C-terminal domain-containing protein [Pontibacter aquaedesilientis]
MRLLLYICTLLLAIPVKAQNGCFRVLQNGIEVTVICAGIPVYFEDCTPNPDPNAIIFYDPGPAAFNPSSFDENKLVRKGSDNRYQYTYTQPGTYRITQIINRAGGGGTTTLERTFEVKTAPEPTFTVTTCASRSAQVTISDTNYNLFDIDYGDGTIRRNVTAGTQPAYTYSNASNSYTITVTAKYNGGSCENSSSKSFTLLPAPTTPVISRLEVIREEMTGEISLNIVNLQPGYSYVIERFSPATARYEPIHTTQVLTQSSLNDYRVQGINTAEATPYRVLPIDPCGTVLSGVASVPLSSISLAVQPGNEKATLTWKGNNANAQRYEITRNGMPLQSVDRNVNAYTDQNLVCGQNYCYRVTGIASGGASTSVSVERCVQVTSTATPPAGYLYTSYDEANQVQLLFTVPQGQQSQRVRYRRSIEGTPYSDIATTDKTEYMDRLQAPNAVCYQAFYTNPCNRESVVSNTSCPVYLIVLPQENPAVVGLGWTGYVGFPDGVGQYTVEVLNENNQVIASYPASGNTFADRNLREEQQDLRYRIKATSGSGNAVTYSNTQVVKQPLQVHVPTAFTPNNDGLNDVLEVKGRFIKDFRIIIYNSMGQVVFTSNDRANSWDGTYQGKLQPAGAYAYEINIITTNGEKKRRTGTVTLLR